LIEDADAVLEPAVCGTRKDEAGETELLNASKTLDERGIEKDDLPGFYAYGSPDRIVDDLRTGRG
jgi:hypothetical protein